MSIGAETKKSFKNVMVMFSIDCFGPGRTSVYIGPFKAKIKRVQTSFQVFQANYHGEIMDSHYGFLRVGCLNSHASSEEKCVEIVKTLHVKFFPFGSVEPVGSVTVK